ncbi:MAG: hypothetical protein GTO18_04545 [Anaerolineales bacterium]|nr:hypothetical protein [Anaerolineales bacterium]
MRVKKTTLLTLSIIILAIVVRLIPGARTIDDAYITFRYAQNLLAGEGMVYNPGERVLGTTTPLYTFLMAGIGFILGGTNAPFPWIALIVNTIADAITCYLLILLGRRFGHERAGYFTAFIWAIAPFSVTFAIGGMETSVFIALMTGTLYCYSQDRPVPAALLASISMLTRPDALLFILPLAADRIRRSLPKSRFIPHPLPITIPEVLAFSVPLSLWIIFGFTYFGNPLPNSILAKADAYHIDEGASFIRLLQHYSTPFLGHLTFGSTWIIIGFILFPILYWLGGLSAIRRWPGSWAILIFPWFYLLAYSVANPLLFRWYLTPPLPILFLGIFLGIERIAVDVKFSNLAYVGFIVAALLTLNGWTLNPDHGSERPAPEMAFIKLELLYENVAHRLQDLLHEDQTLAAGDIGALGYFTGVRILDTVGLITPEAAKYYPLDDAYYVINYAIAPDLIIENQPDYVVILEVYGRKGLLLDNDFLEAYTLIDRIETDMYGSEGMLIFARNSEL